MREGFVVDASVALKWFVVEPESDIADRLLDRAGHLHAPCLLRSELANALWRNWRKRIIDETQATTGLASIGRTIARWHDTEGLFPQAFAWSLTYDHPVYDFCYVALAQAIGWPVVTADDRFLRKLAGTPQAALVRALKDVL